MDWRDGLMGLDRSDGLERRIGGMDWRDGLKEWNEGMD